MMSRIVSHSGRRLLPSVLRLGSASPRSFSSSGEDQHRLFRQQMEQLQEEREELFGFTDEEHAAWGKASGHQHEASFLERIEEARNRAPTDDDEGEDLPSALGAPVDNRDPSMEFTHLSKDQKSVHMVDVGAKTVSQRKAVAQSKVIFPPEIVQAFSPDWKSKKGPIFDTAILAGIMAAKYVLSWTAALSCQKDSCFSRSELLSILRRVTYSPVSLFYQKNQ